jgi:hypothetical protein
MKRLDYLFYAQRAGAVGGRPSKQQTVYIHADGTVMVSVEYSNGMLTSLKTGVAYTAPVLKDMGDRLSGYIQPSPKALEPNQPLEVSEYYPPSVMLRYRFERDTLPVIIEQVTEEMTPVVAHAIKSITAFIDAGIDLQQSPAATYGRIAQVPDPEKHFITHDLSQDQLVGSCANLIHKLRKQPMALIPLDTHKSKIYLGGDKHLSVKKPIYLKMDDSLFLVKVFLFASNH